MHTVQEWPWHSVRMPVYLCQKQPQLYEAVAVEADEVFPGLREHAGPLISRQEMPVVKDDSKARAQSLGVLGLQACDIPGSCKAGGSQGLDLPARHALKQSPASKAPQLDERLQLFMRGDSTTLMACTHRVYSWSLALARTCRRFESSQARRLIKPDLQCLPWGIAAGRSLGLAECDVP